LQYYLSRCSFGCRKCKALIWHWTSPRS